MKNSRRYDGWEVVFRMYSGEVYTARKMYNKPHSMIELSRYSRHTEDVMWESLHKPGTLDGVDRVDIMYHRAENHPAYEGTEEDWF